MQIDWEILIHGADVAIAGAALTSKPWVGAVTGAGVGAGSVLLADGIMDQLMSNPDINGKSPLQAAIVGTIEDTVSALALSLLLDNPITLATVGMGALLGLPEGLLIHSFEGQVDWSHNWFGWN